MSGVDQPVVGTADGPDRRAERPWHSLSLPTPSPTATGSPAGPPVGAGLVTRAVAAVADIAVATGLLVAGYLAVVAVRFLAHPASFRFPTPGRELLVVLGGGALAGYLGLAWSLTGRSFGDQLIGLRVTDRRGRHPYWVLALVRAVFCVLVPVGLLWVAVSRHNRSLQDVLLRTSVVYDRSPP